MALMFDVKVEYGDDPESNRLEAMTWDELAKVLPWLNNVSPPEDLIQMTFTRELERWTIKQVFPLFEREATVNEILEFEADNPVEFEPNEIDAALQDPNKSQVSD